MEFIPLHIVHFDAASKNEGVAEYFGLVHGDIFDNVSRVLAVQKLSPLGVQDSVGCESLSTVCLINEVVRLAGLHNLEAHGADGEGEQAVRRLLLRR